MNASFCTMQQLLRLIYGRRCEAEEKYLKDLRKLSLIEVQINVTQSRVPTESLFWRLGTAHCLGVRIGARTCQSQRQGSEQKLICQWPESKDADPGPFDESQRL